jgi:hypothetical protein
MFKMVGIPFMDLAEHCLKLVYFALYISRFCANSGDKQVIRNKRNDKPKSLNR